MELIPFIWQQFTDSNGSALSSGTIDTYFSGTSTKATTYQDSSGAVNHSNPIILGLDGFPPGGQIWTPAGVPYTFVIKNANGATVKTINGIISSQAGTITASYESLIDAADPMPAYLGLKLVAGDNVTITPITGGPAGTVLQIASTGGGGSAQWEVVALGGVDYLTPVAGLPQKLSLDYLKIGDPAVSQSSVSSGTFSSVQTGVYATSMLGDPTTKGWWLLSAAPDGYHHFGQTVVVDAATTDATYSGAGLVLPDGSWIRPKTPGDNLYITNEMTPGTGSVLELRDGYAGLRNASSLYDCHLNINSNGNISLVSAGNGVNVGKTTGLYIENSTQTNLSITDGTNNSSVALLPISASINGNGSRVTVDIEGVKPTTGVGISAASVLSLDANGAIQSGAITAFDVGAIPACVTQSAVTDYTFVGTEVSGQGWAVNATAANRTITIDADLFATGFEANICKWDGSANTVTIDATAGDTIDGAQTYVLTRQWETVTLLKDGANTWKIKSNYIDPDWFQPLDTQLTAIAALADAHGWLHNDGAGAFSYSTPTASDVGAIPMVTVTNGQFLQGIGGVWSKFDLLGSENVWLDNQSLSTTDANNHGFTVHSTDAGGGDAWLRRYGVDIIRTTGYLNLLSDDGAPTLAWRLINAAGNTTRQSIVLGLADFTPLANNTLALGTTAKRYSNVYTQLLNVAGAATLSSDLTVNNNTTLGDSSSDTLTVNAEISSSLIPTGNTRNLGSATDISKSWGYIITSKGVIAASNSENSGAFTAYVIGDTQDRFDIFSNGRMLWGAGGIVAPDVSLSRISANLLGLASGDNFQIGGLSGTGTRMVTASSTGLVGTRLANSYITQTLTANAAVALDTELLRMTGTGFTGTLTTSIGNSRLISFRNSGTGNLTIACNGAETIDGVATLVIPVGGIAKICSVAAGIWETVL